MIAFRAVQCLLVLADAVLVVHSAAVHLGTAAGLQSLTKRYNDWPSQVAESVFNSSWPEFAKKTTRWSTYAAPTFNTVFIPACGEDLAAGVKWMNLAV